MIAVPSNSGEAAAEKTNRQHNTTHMLEDIVTEILSRLPVKSLSRCKCVCKPWLHVITNDSDFAKLHLYRTLNSNSHHNFSLVFATYVSQKSIFFTLETDAPRKIPDMLEFPFAVSDGDYNMLASCNGLVCLSHHTHPRLLHVWNPSTKEHISLPYPPITPSCYTHAPIFGFGFHPTTQEHKVVRILGDPQEVSVFTLGTNSWRVVEDFSYIVSTRHSRSLVNGALHWIGKIPLADSYDLIISFDIGDEIFREAPLPKDFELFNFKDVMISELSGFLCLTCFSTTDEPEIHVWVMQKYGRVDSWTNLYVISQPHSELGCIHPLFEPLEILNDGKVLFLNNSRLIIYEPRSNAVQELVRFKFETFFSVIPIVRSLISPIFDNGAMVSIER